VLSHFTYIFHYFKRYVFDKLISLVCLRHSMKYFVLPEWFKNEVTLRF